MRLSWQIKYVFGWGLVLILVLTKLQAQNPSLNLPVLPDIYEIPFFEGTSDKGEIVVLQVPYAKPNIVNPGALEGVDPRRVESVELIYTRYPYKFEDWLTDHDWLLESRWEALHELIPEIFDRVDIEWSYVLQTDCPSEPEAMRMFHGFVLHLGPPIKESEEVPPSAIAKAEPDTSVPSKEFLKLVEEDDDLKPLNAVVFDSEFPLKDSTIYYVMKRHPAWQDMLVVMDWTSSMYENGASVVRWYRDHIDRKRLRHLVLFNDGNNKHYKHKRIGKTGGIYYSRTDDIERLLLTMAKVKRRGTGGDPAENDVEALLVGTYKLKSYGDVILIPDRNSSIRDIKLLTKLRVPVRIVLFKLNEQAQSSWGALGIKGENTWIHPHYLTLASKTKGSIHTHNWDIKRLHLMRPGQKIRLGVFAYQKKEDGSFQFAGRVDQ